MTTQTHLTWYGHSAFKITTPAGNVLLLDPWLTNPVFEKGEDELAALKRVDLIYSRMVILITSATRSKLESGPVRNWFPHTIWRKR